MLEKGTLIHCWLECKYGTLTMEYSMVILKKLRIEQSYEPTIPLLGIYPKNIKTLI